MTKASENRRARRLAGKDNVVPMDPEVGKENGVIDLPVDEALRYKLMAMAERIQKHEAERDAIDVRIAAATVERNRVIQEIVEAHKKRLEGKYQMDRMNFDTGLATFTLKTSEEIQS